jgi:hypothetical protein
MKVVAQPRVILIVVRLHKPVARLIDALDYRRAGLGHPKNATKPSKKVLHRNSSSHLSATDFLR